MDKEKLNWRSFMDQQGTIFAKWNVAGTPTLYVIDHKGMIRYKWVGSPGENALDTALEKLIKEAEVLEKSLPFLGHDRPTPSRGHLRVEP